MIDRMYELVTGLLSWLALVASLGPVTNVTLSILSFLVVGVVVGWARK